MSAHTDATHTGASWTPEHRSPSVLNPLPALKHESVLTTVGKTPLIKLQRMAPAGVNVYVKYEAMNPMGSIKDRLAIGCVEWAEAHGQISPGQTVIEATSGNTGIGLAMVCASKGYPLVVVMPEAASIERRKILRFLGAKVLLTNPAHKTGALFQVVNALVKKHGWYCPRQFENEANAWIHKLTTGPEITEAMGGEPLHYLVTAYGTGGTLCGVGQHLREASPHTKILVCEPDISPLLGSGVPTNFDDEGTPLESHPYFRAHLFQGWVPDSISKLVGEASAKGFIDELDSSIEGHEGIATATKLAQTEGIFTGISGGGVLLAALRKAQTCPQGTNIVAILPDTGERYLSTPLFDHIGADMTAEEKELLAQAPPTFALPQPLPEPDDKARSFVDETIKSDVVVVFAFESCEFCWTLFKLLDAIDVQHTRLFFDLPKYASGNFGNKVRAAIQEKTGAKTFPQLFIAGSFKGGAVDACNGWKSGELQQTLVEAGVGTDGKWGGYNGEPYEFLPKWLSGNPYRAK